MTSKEWHAKLDNIIKHDFNVDSDYVKQLMDDLAACEVREAFNAASLLASERSRFCGMRWAFITGAEKYATIISDEGIWENDLRDLKAEAARLYPDI